jgi:hypothetical protein
MGGVLPLFWILPAPPAPVQEPVQEAPPWKPPEAEAALGEALAEKGVHLSRELELCWIESKMLVRDDYLEYLLVGPGGATHESLLVTEAVPSALNVALLALALEPGRNATWNPRKEPITEEELAAGEDPYNVTPPEGDGVYLYLAWREKGEVFFFRAEDLLRNVQSGRSMSRHRWVYLGSRMVAVRPDGPEESFAADLYQNLVNISFFGEGYTLLTGALPECVNQSIWLANAWLLPDAGAPVALIFSRRALGALPETIEKELTEVGHGEQKR